MSLNVVPSPLEAPDPITPPSWSRIGRHRHRARFGLILLAVIVVYLTVVPVGAAVWASLRSTPIGVDGPLTLANYRAALTSAGLAATVRNTAVFAVNSTILAVAFGTYLAYLTERTDVAARRLLYVLALVPVVVPGVLTTIAWSLLLNDRIGLVNLAVMGLTGRTEPVVDAHTMTAMVLVDAADSFTLPFLLMAAAFRSMDPALEEASHVAGASRWVTLRRVTLPLLAPALGASALLVLIRTLDTFQTPAILGLPAGIRVMATEVYVAARLFPTDVNLAATYAVLYLAIALLCLAWYLSVTGDVRRFATITGRGYRPHRLRLGSTRPLHTVVAFAVLIVAVIVPLLVMLYASLLTYYRPPSAGIAQELTLRSYERVLTQTPLVRRAARNTLQAGLGSSVVAVLLGATLAWASLRARSRWTRALDGLATAPIAFPGLVLGVALLWFYLVVPLPVYATLWVVSIAYVTAYLPYTLRASQAALNQLAPELEEASAVAGASWPRTFSRIVIPLLAPALLAGGLYVLTRTFHNVSLPILLAGPGNEVLPVIVFDMQQRARFPELNALGMLMVMALLLITTTAQLLLALRRRWVRRDVAP